ncbi:recombination endonuclease VII [Actinomadura pelletieri DSM 43383]|uniref:Recombination endonuclease VII n=1 Tax=Actinomadura pelletieri DSM 43383 TaxID=1120940 RepID=A0A495QLE2_9ACTN|nr:endonuclease VII domain-containing protein [Actinomadura pelletieri]RKS73395.1 recombination endonuclease VII [Actinomadura pelletieri DSM 43383]
MSSKRCPDCGELKSAEEFWKLRASKDGLAPYCKICFGLRNSRSYRKKQAQAGKTPRPYRRHADVPDGMKYCARCRATKPIEAFGSNRSEKSGLATYCRPCHNRAIEEIRNRNHGSTRNYLLKLRYGVTEEQVDQMIAEQGGVCVICLRADAKHVDHDHLTGLVRRVLCFKCNGGLGQFRDDPDRLRLAADYLELRGSHARLMRIEIGAPVFGGPDRVRWDPEWRTKGAAARSARHYHLRQKYGINDEDTEWLRKVQVGLCGVCFDFPAEHVDHDHVSGSVRGLACSGCNTGMGQLRDDPVALRRAADYVTGRLVRTVTGEDGRERLSLTVPDVDPVTVARGGWKAIWEEDGRYRKRTLPFDEELDMPTWGGAGPEGVVPSV